MLLQSAPLILAQNASAPNSTTTQKTSVSSGKKSSFNDMLASFKKTGTADNEKLSKISEPEVKEKTITENKVAEKDVPKKNVAKKEDSATTEQTAKVEKPKNTSSTTENESSEKVTDEKAAFAISEAEIENILAASRLQENAVPVEAASLQDVTLPDVQVAENVAAAQDSGVLQTLISDALDSAENGKNYEQDFVVLGDADTFQKLVSGQKPELNSEKKSDVTVDAEKLLVGAETKDANAEIAMAKHFSESHDNENNQGNFNSNAENARTFKLDNEGKISVTDYRTKFDTEISAAQNMQNVNAENISTATASSVKISGVSEHKDISGQNLNTVQMNMNLAQAAEQNILSSNSQTASATGSDFHAMLTNQIRENASEFVKAGSIVLRDGNMGEINLTLNPEKLGNVKISLQLSDKLITGQITAFTREAYNAFRESADNLRQAFVQSGFEMNGFDISWSGQDAQSGFAESQNNEARHFAASKTYSDYASGIADESLVREYNGYSDYSVNVTA